MRMRSICVAICLMFLLSGNGLTADAPKVEVKVLAKSGKSWDGQSLPAYPKGVPEISILHITIPPKTTLPLHHHPVINAGVMLEGELTVITETDKVLHLKKGDALIEVVETIHYGKNEGDTPVVIIVFYAGVKDQAVTVKE